MNTAIHSGININDGDEVLTSFAQEYAAGSASLSDWAARYPQYARDFARYAADRWAGETETSTVQPDAALLARVRTGRLAAARAARESVVARQAAVPTTALSTLLGVVRAKGLTPEAVSDTLGIPYALFFKLHRRLIAPDSVPRSFVRALAEAVERTTDEITAYLRQPPTLAAGASYRADDKPTVGEQEAFADALRSDPDSTEAQRTRWQNAE